MPATLIQDKENLTGYSSENDDPMLTFELFTDRSNFLRMVRYGKKIFNGRFLRNCIILRISLSLNANSKIIDVFFVK